MSAETSKLAAALSAFLGDVKDPALDGVNPHFKSKYATLPGVLQAVRPLLAKHKLAVCQTPELQEGKLVLKTRLLHAEGETIESVMPLPESANMQALGSALTYARRYALTCVLGCAGDEDDDGHEASKPGTKTAPASKPTPSAPKAQPPAKSAPDAVAFANGIDDSVDDIDLSDWESFVVPSGKLAGKRLDELDENQATWFCTRWAAKREADKPFRLALNSLARAIGLDKKDHAMTSLVLDIETGALPALTLAKLMPEFSAPKNIKDPAKISEAVEAKRTAFFDDAALDALTGRIVAVGVLAVDGANETPAIVHGDGDEAALLRETWDTLAAWHESPPSGVMVTYNGHLFDLPFLCRRSMLCGVPVPAWVRRGRYWCDSFVDLREVWQFGDRSAATGGLDGLAKAFGLSGKNGSGKHFAALWESDRAAAESYLLNDLKLTAAIARKMGVLP